MPFSLARDLAACGGRGMLVFGALLLAGAIAFAWAAFRPGRRTGAAPRLLAGVFLFFGATWAAGALSGALDPGGAAGCRADAVGLDPLVLLPLGLLGLGALVVYADGRFGVWRDLAERFPAFGPVQGQRLNLESV